MIRSAKLRSGRLTGVMKRLLLGVRKLAIDFDLSQSQGTARLLPVVLEEDTGKVEGLDQLSISKVGSVDGAVGYGVNVVMTGERNKQLIAHGQPLEIWPQFSQLAIFGRL